MQLGAHRMVAATADLHNMHFCSILTLLAAIPAALCRRALTGLSRTLTITFPICHRNQAPFTARRACSQNKFSPDRLLWSSLDIAIQAGEVIKGNAY